MAQLVEDLVAVVVVNRVELVVEVDRVVAAGFVLFEVLNMVQIGRFVVEVCHSESFAGCESEDAGSLLGSDSWCVLVCRRSGWLVYLGSETGLERIIAGLFVNVQTASTHHFST